LKAQFELAHQDPSSNYNTLINSTLDICGFFNETQSNPLSNFFFNAFKDSLPKGLFSSCPIKGEYKTLNMTLNGISQMVQVLVGSYRTITRFYDEKDENLITVNHLFELKRLNFNKRRN
jgi:Protein of unknown function (DUF1091)